MQTNGEKIALKIGADEYSYNQLHVQINELKEKLDEFKEAETMIVDIKQPLKLFAAIFAAIQMKKRVAIFDYNWPDNYKMRQLKYFNHKICVVSDVSSYREMGVEHFYDYKEMLQETKVYEDMSLYCDGLIAFPAYYMGGRVFLEMTTQMVQERLKFCEEILKISWNCVRSFGTFIEELVFDLFTLLKGGTLVIDENIKKALGEYDCVIAKLPQLKSICDDIVSKRLMPKRIITYGMDTLSIIDEKKQCKEMGIGIFNFFDYPYYRFITSAIDYGSTVCHQGKTVRGIAPCILNDGGRLENSDISGHVGVVENGVIESKLKVSNLASDKPVVYTGFYGKKSDDNMILFQRIEGDVICKNGKIISLSELKKCLCEFSMIEECEYEYTSDSTSVCYSLKEEALGCSLERIKAYISETLPAEYKEVSLIKSKNCGINKVKTVPSGIVQNLLSYLKSEGVEALVEPDVAREHAVELFAINIEIAALEKKIHQFLRTNSKEIDTVSIYPIDDEKDLYDLEIIRQSKEAFVCKYNEEQYLKEREKAVLNVFRDILQNQSLRMDDNFFDNGGNSVSFIKLCAELSKLSGFEIQMQDVIVNATPAYCSDILCAGKSEQKDDELVDINLLKNDADIEMLFKESIDIIENPSDVENVFLTGASGFIGSFILKRLLEEKAGLIYCLVRANSEQDGMQRIREVLKRYGLEKNIDDSRIRIVLGDLEKERFGCDTKMYDKLAKDVSIIYHNGAKVDFMYPYKLLRRANVEGTKEIIKLATCCKKKVINYISSAAVLSGIVGVDDLDEKIDIEAMPPIISGYNQSKWVGDIMMQAARKHNVKCNIFRLGTACGDSINGCCQVKDFAWLVMKLSTEIGYYTDFNLDLNLIPVNYIANAIVRLSTEDKTDLGSNYHVFGSENMDLTQIFHWLQEHGYKLEEVPFDIWCLQVENYLKTSEVSEELQAVYAVIAASTAMADDYCEDYEDTGAMRSDWTMKQLRQLDEEFHSVTKEQFIKNIDYFSKIGFLREV
ncbi:MAG: thioester reductase domain-containing protein [Pseudobutyrivibrio sp.]|nr:thioester reductase domain-containing protein [Pseudobutyrivibrio sp.]